MEKLLKPILVSITLLFVSLFFYKSTTKQLDTMRVEQAKAISFVSMKQRDKELKCLANNIYYEAGGENFEGKVAVAQVTINRTQDENFPKDVCGVVYQKNVVYKKVLCQFSWYCQSPNSAIDPKQNSVYHESMEVAKKVLLEGFRLSSLNNALYFHADSVNPKWPNRTRIIKIGGHIFYS